MSSITSTRLWSIFRYARLRSLPLFWKWYNYDIYVRQTVDVRWQGNAKVQAGLAQHPFGFHSSGLFQFIVCLIAGAFRLLLSIAIIVRWLEADGFASLWKQCLTSSAPLPYHSSYWHVVAFSPFQPAPSTTFPLALNNEDSKNSVHLPSAVFALILSRGKKLQICCRDPMNEHVPPSWFYTLGSKQHESPSSTT